MAARNAPIVPRNDAFSNPPDVDTFKLFLVFFYMYMGKKTPIQFYWHVIGYLCLNACQCQNLSVVLSYIYIHFEVNFVEWNWQAWHIDLYSVVYIYIKNDSNLQNDQFIG